MSQITKTKRLGRSNSMYLSSNTEPISYDSSTTETSFTSSQCSELSCSLPVGTLFACLAPVLAEVRNKTDPIYILLASKTITIKQIKIKIQPTSLLPFCLLPFCLLPFRLFSNFTPFPFRLHLICVPAFDVVMVKHAVICIMPKK